MANTRLALVAIKGSYEGPWIVANGRRYAHVSIYGLGPESQVSIEYERKGVFGETLALPKGKSRVEIQKWDRYRFVKRAPEEDRVATTVEMEFEQEALSV